MKEKHSTSPLWTSGLAVAGLVTFGPAVQGEEAQAPVMTALSSTTISGYVDTSAILNFGASTHTVGRSFDGDAKQDGFNLNAVKVQLERPLQEGRWSAGYRVGLVFGPDANTFATTSTGTANATSDYAIKNAYVNLRAPLGTGLEFKLGVFDTMMGYEVFEAGNNPNYSRSFGYYLEPLVHTGLLVTYRLGEYLTLSGGVADPNNVLVNPNTINTRSSERSQFSYMGSATLIAPPSAGFLKGGSFTVSVMDHGRANAPDVFQLYAGASIPLPVANLSFGVAYDYRGNSGDAGTSERYANAFGGYLVYKFTEKSKLAARAEYATGTIGTWTSSTWTSLQSPPPTSGAVAPPAGKHDELLGITATLDYTLWANVVSRLEFRWDRDLSNSGVFSTSAPYDQNDSLSVALNVIYSF